jgi:hypothetical protein
MNLINFKTKIGYSKIAPPPKSFCLTRSTFFVGAKNVPQ